MHLGSGATKEVYEYHLRFTNVNKDTSMLRKNLNFTGLVSLFNLKTSIPRKDVPSFLMFFDAINEDIYVQTEELCKQFMYECKLNK